PRELGFSSRSKSTASASSSAGAGLPSFDGRLLVEDGPSFLPSFDGFLVVPDDGAAAVASRSGPLLSMPRLRISSSTSWERKRHEPRSWNARIFFDLAISRSSSGDRRSLLAASSSV